jgi:hypothetical protein
MLLHVNGDAAPGPIFKRHHDDLRQFWQARMLIRLHETGQAHLAAVALSVIAHSFPDAEALRTLLQVCFPGFISLRPPFYCSAGRVMKTGEIAADLVCRDGSKVRHALVFQSKAEMEGAWRRLCDELKFSDEDRAAAFAALKAWVVADFGRDPNRATGEP